MPRKIDFVMLFCLSLLFTVVVLFEKIVIGIFINVHIHFDKRSWCIISGYVGKQFHKVQIDP